MSTIGNILWFLFGGLIGGLAWVLAGCLWCITIIGIPVGLQCFKFASLAFSPFGKEVVYGGGGFSFLVNLIWIIFFGLEMAIGYCILGCLWCITILGIPIGKQCFKMAKLSLIALRGIGRVKQYCMRPLPHGLFPIREKSNDSNENTLNRLRRIRHGRDHQYEYRYRDSAWR